MKEEVYVDWSKEGCWEPNTKWGKFLCSRGWHDFHKSHHVNIMGYVMCYRCGIVELNNEIYDKETEEEKKATLLK